MHRIDWTTALLRVSAVWIAFSTLAGIGSSLQIAFRDAPDNSPMHLALLAGVIAIPALAAAGLWRWAPAIAKLIWRGPTPPEADPPSPVTADELQHALIVLLGLWFAMSGMIDLAYVAVAVNAGSEFSQAYSRGDLLGQLLWTALEIAAAAVLVMGAEAFVRLLKRLRPARLRPDA